jgi:hypothetical protein
MKSELKKVRRRSKPTLAMDCAIPETPQSAFVKKMLTGNTGFNA